MYKLVGTCVCVCVWTLHHHFFFRKVTLTGVLSRVLSLWGGKLYKSLSRGSQDLLYFTCRSFKVEVKSRLELNFSLELYFFLFRGGGGEGSRSIWEGCRLRHTRLDSVNGTYPAGHSLWILFSTLSQSVIHHPFFRPYQIPCPLACYCYTRQLFLDDFPPQTFVYNAIS